MSYVIDPDLDQDTAAITAIDEINANTLPLYFRQCAEHRELLNSIEVVVPVRPEEGMNCDLTRILSIWYSEGTAWSHLNDNMGGFIELTRANIAYHFRNASNDKPPKYLLMLDNDMVPPLNLPYLLARHDVPVVGAVAIHMHGEYGPRACLTLPCKDGQNRWPCMREHMLPAKGLIECGHLGTGAMMIRRDVLEAFTFDGGPAYKKYEQAKKDNTELNLSAEEVQSLLELDVPFFTRESDRIEGSKTGHLLLGEDLMFCEQVRAKGFKVYADLEAHCGHFKQFPMIWDASRRDPRLDHETFSLPPTGVPVGAWRGNGERKTR